MTDLTPEEKKILLETMGEVMGQGMKDVLPKQIEIGEKMRKEYIERLTRIETKLDVLISLLRVPEP